MVVANENRCMNHAHKKQIFGLALSNFFFVGSYGFLAAHALFLHSVQNSFMLRDAIILGMGLYAGLQVGGVWLISFFGEKWTKNIQFMFCLRILAMITLLIPNPTLQIISFFCYGISQAIFFKKSRTLLSQILTSFSNSTNFYVLFGITTNFSLMFFQLVGSFLLKNKINSIFLFFVGLVLCGLTLICIPNLKVEEKKIESDEEKNVCKEVENKNLMEFFLDLLRFLGFVAPYGVMISIVSIKASAMGLDAGYNSVLLGFNAVAVVILQTLSLRFPILKFNIKRYDWVTFVAVLCCVFALISNFWFLIPLFVIWSFCEAYQLPNIEYYVFSYKKISGKFLNRILALDAIICFVGPMIASAGIEVIHFSNVDHVIKNIIDALITMVFGE